MTATVNDAVGGAGSFLGSLGSILTRGVSSAVDGALSKKFGLGYFNQTLALDADGNPKPAAQPAKTAHVGDSIASALRNPVVLAGVGITIALVAYIVARK